MPVRPTSATAVANAVATATSRTFPPAANSSTPTAAAIGCWADATPRTAWTGGSPASAIRTAPRAVTLAEGIAKGDALQAANRQTGIEPFRAHAGALADAVTAPDAMPSVHLLAAQV